MADEDEGREHIGGQRARPGRQSVEERTVTPSSSTGLSAPW